MPSTPLLHPTVVQKFGGTSVGTAERMKNVASIVKTSLVDSKPIVVLSAMSSYVKAEGTTSMLLEAAEIFYSQTLHVLDIVAIADKEIRERTEADVRTDCEKLRSFMSAAEIIDEISPRSRDIIISTTFELKSLDQSFYDYLTQRLAEVVAAQPDDAVLLGYTDLTAALIAVGTEAQELQIWKEVDVGLYFYGGSGKAPNAKLLPSISPEEAAELTYYGSEVIHPFTMEHFPPMASDIMRRIRSHQNTPRRVTIKDNVIVLNVHSNRKSVSHGFFAQIFSTLDKFGIVVDLISTSEVHVSMALSPNVVPKKLESAMVELRKCGTVDTIAEMAILSLVGREMRNSVGIASLMFSTLAKHNEKNGRQHEGDP
ncbi:Aspartate/glutamate/uridylate kinase [Chytridium lagenaria]|nr:Aspartate/glutamate/uridylate kinase [Chytridium lagenaria]